MTYKEKYDVYFLNIVKVFSLKKSKRDEIMSLYKEYLHADGITYGNSMKKSIFNTLEKSGFLISDRDQKIDLIISDGQKWYINTIAIRLYW